MRRYFHSHDWPLLLLALVKVSIGFWMGFVDNFFQQKPNAKDESQSFILTWRLSESSKLMWFLPKPFVLFTFAEKMAVAVEHSLNHLLREPGK